MHNFEKIINVLVISVSYRKRQKEENLKEAPTSDMIGLTHRSQK